jgi:hypothetical protein
MTKDPAAFGDNPPTAAGTGTGALPRRRVASLLVLLPAAALLAACATAKSDETQTRYQRQPTYKNGLRGRGGPGSR